MIRLSSSFRRLLGSAAEPLLAAALLVCMPVTAVGQEVSPDRPEANPEDVESPEAVVEAAAEAISGPPGERDLDRFRSLFHPEANLVSTDRENGEPAQGEWTLQEYVSLFKKAFADSALYERVVNTVTQRFGDMAHVWATFEQRHSPDDDPYRRGIDAFQLWYDGERWWIRNIIAHAEREGAPIPERYGG